MFSWKLFEQSWAILRRVRLLWVLSIAYVLWLLINSLLPSKHQEFLLSCGLYLFSLLFNLLPSVISAGMIVVVDRDLAALPISVKEVWHKVRPLLGSIILIDVLFMLTSITLVIVFLVLLCVFCYFFMSLSTGTLFSKEVLIPILLLASLSTVILTGPTLEYGLRGVCVEQKPALKGFYHGITQYRRSFPQAFGISFLGIVLFACIHLIIFVINLLINGKDITGNLLSLSLYQQFITVSSTIASRTTSFGVSLITIPYNSILFTLLYKQVLENEKNEKLEEETYPMPSNRKPRRYLRRKVSLGLRKIDDSA